jgi:hypothetical protein
MRDTPNTNPLPDLLSDFEKRERFREQAAQDHLRREAEARAEREAKETFRLPAGCEAAPPVVEKPQLSVRPFSNLPPGVNNG